jgi:FkbM family methyltransferase
MKKAFIDLGSYKGDSIEQFKNWIQLIDNPGEYDIFAFEPNPDLFDTMRKKAGSTKRVIFRPWAATTYDGEIEMAIDKTPTPMGSTVIPSKVAIWDNYPHIKVKCFDFAKWLKSKFKGSDKVIIKMDIEGAEFPVLESMIENDSITIANPLFVEFHEHKTQAFSGQDKLTMIARIKDNGGHFKPWH